MPDEESKLPVAVSDVKTELSVPFKISIATSVLLLLLGAFLLLTRSWEPESASLLGEWVAEVEYGPGNAYTERFELRLTGATLSGFASYLGTRLAIEQAVLDGTRVSFVTRSRDRIGNRQRELVHEYGGEFAGDTMHFRLRTSSGGVELGSVEFVANRPD